MFKFIKRIKALYNAYNLLNYQRLRYLTPLLNLYGLNKSFYSSLSSKDMPTDSSSDHPWLDQGNSALLLPRNTEFLQFNSAIKSALLNWSDNGFAILKGFFTEEKVALINELLIKLMEERHLTVKDNRKIMHAVRYSDEIKNLANPEKLTSILELLMGTPVELFQSVNFLYGSEDPAHSDFIHMSTYPYGYLLAVWIALEDIDSSNGPIVYYPGSHKLPYLMNSQFEHGGNRWLLGKNSKQQFARAIAEEINCNNF